MGRACSTRGAKRNAYRILAGKPEGKKLLGRPRPLAGFSEHGNETSGSIELWEILEWLSD
jgi:hypothetical protein